MDEKVEHLLLLVGENPLPNALAGKLLATENGVVTLLHSRTTFETARRIKSWLETSFSQQGTSGIKFSFKEIDQSSPSSIERYLIETLDADPKKRVGLNYTGGTKAMAVHAYRAVERWAEGKGARASFSYLDAHTLSMLFDPKDPASGELGRSKPIGLDVKMGLNDLMALHGWRLKGEAKKKPVLLETALALADANSTDEGQEAWKKWKAEVLTELGRRKEEPHKWRKQSELRQLHLPYPKDPILAPVVEQLKVGLGQPGETLSVEAGAKTCGFKDLEDFCKWLDGAWLESVVLAAFLQITEENQLHDVLMSINPENETTTGGKPPNFELDVVALRGYQLFAVSCTTEDKSHPKLKLFEAITRAKQLGGDEARVALVCLDKKPESLELEMHRNVNAEGIIRVFGRKHVPDLQSHLSDWIQSQSGGGR